jgi:hypothetical protein
MGSTPVIVGHVERLRSDRQHVIRAVHERSLHRAAVHELVSGMVENLDEVPFLPMIHDEQGRTAILLPQQPDPVGTELLVKAGRELSQIRSFGVEVKGVDRALFAGITSHPRPAVVGRDECHTGMGVNRQILRAQDARYRLALTRKMGHDLFEFPCLPERPGDQNPERDDHDYDHGNDPFQPSHDSPSRLPPVCGAPLVRPGPTPDPAGDGAP